MKKLLKFAAPILILALLFASCDDRGSAPSGGDTSGLTLTVTLPTRTDYPAEGSAFEVSINSGKTSVPASKVTYYAAGEYEGVESAMLVASGFKAPEGGFAAGSTATVTFTNEFGSIFTASELTLSGILETATTVSAFKQIPNIAITVSAPAGNYTLELPKEYKVTFAADGKEPVTIEAEAEITPAVASSSVATAAITIKAADALKALGLGTYDANIQTVTQTVGENTYTFSGATAEGISFTAGGAGTGAITLAQTWTGAIEVTIPATYGESKDVPSSVSYEVLQGATAIIPESTATVAENKFTTDAVFPTVASTGATYTVNVWFEADGVTYKATNTAAGPTSPTGSTSPITDEPKAGSATLTAFVAQVASLTVTLSGISPTWPTNPAQYTVFSYALSDEAGNPIGEAKTIALTAEELDDGSEAPTIPAIEGLEVGAYYAFSVEVNDLSKIYTAKAVAGPLAPGSGNTLAIALNEKGTTTAISLAASKDGVTYSGLSSVLDAVTAVSLPLTGSGISATPALINPFGSIELSLTPTGTKAAISNIDGISLTTLNTNLSSGLAEIVWNNSTGIAIGDNSGIKKATFAGTYDAESSVFTVSSVAFSAT